MTMKDELANDIVDLLDVKEYREMAILGLKEHTTKSLYNKWKNLRGI